MYQVTKAVYRFAETDDEIPPERVVAILDTPGVATVAARPGHATQRLLDALTREQTAMLATGEWMRQAPGDGDAPTPTIHSARWERVPAHRLPAGRLCIPVQLDGEHVWLIREDEASEELVSEMSELLTALVRAGVWTRFGVDGRCV